MTDWTFVRSLPRLGDSFPEEIQDWVLKSEADKRISELKMELDFVVQAWVKPQDELTPDEINYMMSAREALADEKG